MPNTLIIIALSLAAAALLALWALARAALVAERQKSAQLGQSLTAVEADRDAQRNRAEERHVRVAILDTTLVEFHKNIRDRQLALDAAHSDLEASRQSESSLRGELAKTEALHAERQAQFQNFQAKLDEHLAALTRKLYDEHGPKMMGEGRQQLEQALAPFKEKLTEFQNRVNEVHAGDLRDRASLEAALRKDLEGVLKAQSQLSGDAQRLTLALTGDSKAQGDWGELTLKRLLEESGLRQGTDYKLQQTVAFEHYEGEDEIHPVRPDAIIFLPEGRAVVIDAKVNLTAHARAVGTTGEERQSLMAEHIKSVKNQVAMLTDKEYARSVADYLDKSVPDFVLMFMPTEASIAAAMEQDPGLWLWAYHRKVVIVGPTTLLTTLRVVEQQWRIERQNRNTDEIVREASILVAKLAASIDEFEKADTAISNALTLFRSAKNRLSGGAGSVTRRAERMIELGIKASPKAKTTLAGRDADEDDEAAQSPEA